MGKNTPLTQQCPSMIKEAKQKEIRNETAATTMLQLTWGRRSFARPVAQPMCDPIVVTYQAWATFQGQALTLAPEQINVLCFATCSTL